MAYKVFICYRRNNMELARGIQGRLAAEFGSDAIFMDIDSVGGGRDWEKRVTEVLEDKPVVVTLITTIWNSRRGGEPRLLDEHDHVRFELEAALDAGLPVVPVLYDRARLPKEDQLPSTLHALLRFQMVPMSQDRWVYDNNELIKALKQLLEEPPKASPQPATSEASPQPAPSATRPAIGTQFPALYTRSMFQETPEQRRQRLKELEERIAADQKRRREARAREPAFFARWEFWAASLLTLILGIGALAGAEFLAVGTAGLTSSFADRWDWFPDDTLPSPSMLAAVLLVGLWALARISSSAAAYWDDPELGARAFFTRGVFGGYTLFFEDYETVGIWAAWPIATVIAWVLARIVAWIPLIFWGWSYELIFWIALGLYTLPVLAGYVLLTLDEVL